jgi:hypothetical protein
MKIKVRYMTPCFIVTKYWLFRERAVSIIWIGTYIRLVSWRNRYVRNIGTYISDYIALHSQVVSVRIPGHTELRVQIMLPDTVICMY